MISSPLPGMRSGESLLVKAAATIVIVATLLPIATVIILSFTSANTTQFPPPGFSLRWYQAAWDMSFGPDADIARLREALVTSLQIAAMTALLCLAAGLPAAYALARHDFAGKRLVDTLVDLPMVFPTIVLGIALLIIVSSLPVRLGMTQLVIAHTIITLPFMIRNIAAALHGLDPNLQEAAQTLGAAPWRAFYEIVLPLIRSGMASGLILVFVLSFNEFTLTYFLSSIDARPLAIWLFQQSNTTLDPSIFSVSSLIIAVNIGAIIIIDRATSAIGAR